MSNRDLSPASPSTIANLSKPASIEGYFISHLFIFLNYLLKSTEEINTVLFTSIRRNLENNHIFI